MTVQGCTYEHVSVWRDRKGLSSSKLCSSVFDAVSTLPRDLGNSFRTFSSYVAVLKPAQELHRLPQVYHEFRTPQYLISPAGPNLPVHKTPYPQFLYVPPYTSSYNPILVSFTATDITTSLYPIPRDHSMDVSLNILTTSSL